MRPAPEEVLAIASQIVELKRRLSEAQIQWDAMFPQDVPPASSIAPLAPSTSESSSTRVREGSGVAKILEALNQWPDRNFEPLRISEELGMPLGTTRTVLSKLVKKGLIEKRGAARYGSLTAREKEVPSVEKTS
jgi:hypothetical protein